MSLKQLIPACAIFFVASASAVPVTINDDYIGADDHGYGDVIGAASKFDIQDMVVDIIGTQMSVTINTNFAAGSGLGTFGTYTYDGNGIGFGDLFLSSTGWNPDTSAANYLNDDATTGTLWDYGISLHDRWNGTSTAATLYQLDTSGGNTQALTSDDFMKGNAIWRNNQEVAVDTGLATSLGTLSNLVSTSGGQVVFQFDIAGTALASASEIGLHWAMTCGNDTIEGAYTAVPSPDSAMLMMLALGLVGFGSLRARKMSGRPALFN